MKKGARYIIKSAVLADILQVLQGTTLAFLLFHVMSERNSLMQDFYLGMAACTLCIMNFLNDALLQQNNRDYEIVILPCRRRAHFISDNSQRHKPFQFARGNANFCIRDNVKYVYI